ncbi:hypothetical protein [Piscinibacter sp.]|jgi:hypothetical protein|uniref:hypothetical protein n=1 Tax=Piscinibacter sp. TaxID=1903157 RepID=UPI00355ACAA6
MSSSNSSKRTSAPTGGPGLLRPLHWLKLVFATPIRVQRRGQNLRLVFDDKPPRTPAAPEPVGTPSTQDVSLRAMRKALRHLLDQHADVRRVMRHLCHLESALKRSGDQAFDELPVELLRTALTQFEGLVTDWSPGGLAELRSRLAVSVMAQEQPAQYEPAGSKLSDFCTSQRMQVQEITHSDFEKMANSWVGRQPEAGPDGTPCEPANPATP